MGDIKKIKKWLTNAGCLKKSGSVQRRKNLPHDKNIKTQSTMAAENVVIIKNKTIERTIVWRSRMPKINKRKISWHLRPTKTTT